MPKILQIIELGDQILIRKAQPIKDVSDPMVQTLIDDMIYTCKDAGGVGIAAPQVGQSLRLFIISSKPSPWYPNAPEMEPTAIINPVIIFSWNCEGREKNWEGCLSIPGIRGLVLRDQYIKVSFLNRGGERKEETFDGLVARVFQHELDHLDGIVFLEHTKPRDLATEREYQKIIQGPPVEE